MKPVLGKQVEPVGLDAEKRGQDAEWEADRDPEDYFWTSGVETTSSTVPGCSSNGTS